MILTRGGRLIRSLGNRVPFWAQIPGRSFPEGLDRENTSQSECLFRDAVSARGPFGKSWPVSAADSGMGFPLDVSVGKSIPF